MKVNNGMLLQEQLRSCTMPSLKPNYKNTTIIKKMSLLTKMCTCPMAAIGIAGMGKRSMKEGRLCR
jgi:hypothetical protein